MALAVLVAVALQLVLPDRHEIPLGFLLPFAEVGLLLAMVIGDPGRIDRKSSVQRWLTMAMVLVMTVDNLAAVIALVTGILEGDKKDTATVLLATGAAIWLTNVIVFSLWYWELDRGGPAARAAGSTRSPSFAFAEMQNPDLAPPSWSVQYVDYLHLAFTTATAFSPTDTLPLKSWAKLMMMAQSSMSLVTGIMIISQGINILN